MTPTTKVRLERFRKEDYDDLISWIENETMLMQIAGPQLIFPLTPEQLDISLSDKNRIAFKIVDDFTQTSVGHSEIYLAENSAKIGRILIGSEKYRGKGLGRQIVDLLLNYSFSNFQLSMIELNVFDWNIAAISCYEKAGFKINPDKKREIPMGNEVWTVLNMTIYKDEYERLIGRQSNPLSAT